MLLILYGNCHGLVFVFELDESDILCWVGYLDINVDSRERDIFLFDISLEVYEFGIFEHYSWKTGVIRSQNYDILEIQSSDDKDGSNQGRISVERSLRDLHFFSIFVFNDDRKRLGCVQNVLENIETDSKADFSDAGTAHEVGSFNCEEFADSGQRVSFNIELVSHELAELSVGVFVESEVLVLVLDGVGPRRNNLFEKIAEHVPGSSGFQEAQQENGHVEDFFVVSDVHIMLSQESM